MTDVFAQKALLAGGWANNVRLGITAGRVVRLESDAAAKPGDTVAGIVIPGLCNAHSHAFQRALVGRTEHRGADKMDTFWTWRRLMYALSAQLTPAALTAIARQVYTEMLASGYTSVVEFHYLHGAAAGKPDPMAMFNALSNAANDSGIRMTYVPVLYERGDFDGTALAPEQQRFALSLDGFLDHYREAADWVVSPHSMGIGAHSLRAVSAAALDVIANQATTDAVPVHLHIAEQQLEVDRCLGHYRARPVRWLLDNFAIDDRWTLVHATHMDAEEVVLLAQSGAVVCLCPSTEANLGDGFFRLQEYLDLGGKISIGSDSHVTVNPFEELRWLEYGQRLLAQQRNVAANEHTSTGSRLFTSIVAGGALSAGRTSGKLREGAPADLLVLDDNSPMFAGHESESLLDALLFSGLPPPIERVMVNGVWCVSDGAHRDAADTAEAYAQAVDGIDLRRTIAT